MQITHTKFAHTPVQNRTCFSLSFGPFEGLFFAINRVPEAFDNIFMRTPPLVLGALSLKNKVRQPEKKPFWGTI